MISLCEVFAKIFYITFNCKKTVCLKFGQQLIGYEHVYLNDKKNKMGMFYQYNFLNV